MMDDKDNISILAKEITKAYEEARETIKIMSEDEIKQDTALAALDEVHAFIRSMPSLQKTAELDTYLEYYRETMEKIKSPELLSLLPDYSWEYAKQLYWIYRKWRGYMLEIIQKSGIWERPEEEMVIDKVNYELPSTKVRK